MASVGKVMRAGHRLGGGVGEVFARHQLREKNVESELAECKRTRTLFEYPLGKPLEATR